MSEIYSPAGNVSAQNIKRATAGEAATGTHGQEFMRDNITQIADRIRFLDDSGNINGAFFTTPVEKGIRMSTQGTPFSFSVNSGVANGVRDDILYFAAYNIVEGTVATKVTAGEPLMHFHMEAHYFDSAQHWMEINLDYLSIDNLTSRRPLALQINRSTHGTGWALEVARDGTGTTGIVQITSHVGVLSELQFIPRTSSDVTDRRVYYRLVGGTHELFQVGGDGSATAPNESQLGPSATTAPEVRILKAGQMVLSGGFARGRVVLAYSASISPDAKLGSLFEVVPTNGTGFAINNAANPVAGQQFTFRIKNTFGVLGALSWGVGYKLGAAWTQPANGFSRSITFDYDGANFVEATRSAVDVAN